MKVQMLKSPSDELKSFRDQVEHMLLMFERNPTVVRISYSECKEYGSQC